MNGNVKYFVVLTAGRSGSNVLQELMKLNGFCDPNEWYNLELFFNKEVIKKGITTEIYTRFLVENKSIGGMFCVKLMSNHLEAMIKYAEKSNFKTDADIVSYLFPGAKYVLLKRRDLYRQAISVWRAYKTGEYIKRNDDETNKIPDAYDFGEILKSYNYVIRTNSVWETYINENDIDILTVYYEDLVENVKDILKLIIYHASGKDLNVENIKTRLSIYKQSDSISEVYLEKFIKDSKGLERYSNG